jgi:hypothetical protein
VYDPETGREYKSTTVFPDQLGPPIPDPIAVSKGYVA